jgi:hypothetical protein
MNWRYLMLHHSLTADSETVSWSAIRRFHTNTLGWRDVGYHAGVEQVGSDYETLLGRPWNQIGAHCRQGGMNRQAFGLCLVGNFDELPPPPTQWLAAVRLARMLIGLFDVPVGNIVGHRDYAPKTCPRRAFDLDEFRSVVAGGL